LRALLLAIIFSMAAGAAQAQSTRVAGTAGYLSEWQFSGDLKKTAAADRKEFSGSLTWKHVGLCSVNGPEEKFGDMTLQISRLGPAPQIQAGVASESSTGRMNCSNAEGIPLTLSINEQLDRQLVTSAPPAK
jgi:hypothetical protein